MTTEIKNEEPDIFKSLKEKGITESSAKLYISNIKRLNDNEPIKNFNFLKKGEIILKKISHLKPNTQRSYLIAIVSLLKGNEKLKKVYDFYYTLMMNANKDLKSNTTKSETQSENWISQEEVKNIYNSLKESTEQYFNKKKLNESDFDKILSFVILSLYVLTPPRRNKDYQEMILTKNKNDELKVNQLDLNDNQFIFKVFKTSKTYPDQVVKIPEDLQQVIKSYISVHPLNKMIKKGFDAPFLVDFEGHPISSINFITRVLNKIFKKKVGVSMLRNIYLTDKYSDESNEKNKDAQAMGTSVNMLDNNYIKTD